MKTNLLPQYFRKKFIGGLGVGLGLVAGLAIVLLVNAITPGTITNPTFGPQDDDVELTSVNTCVAVFGSTCPAGTNLIFSHQSDIDDDVNGVTIGGLSNAGLTTFSLCC